MARRRLEEGEAMQWLATWKRASVSLQARERQLAAAAEAVEVELELLGASAIEDKLQEGVAGTIRTLRRAGMRVWMLTGDKEETAVNIATSSALVSDEME
eukprot:617752-Pleurochrysis_carterae.AAC.1